MKNFSGFILDIVLWISLQLLCATFGHTVINSDENDYQNGTGVPKFWNIPDVNPKNVTDENGRLKGLQQHFKDSNSNGTDPTPKLTNDFTRNCSGTKILVENTLTEFMLNPTDFDNDMQSNRTINGSANTLRITRIRGISKEVYSHLSVIIGRIWFILSALGLLTNILNITVFLDKKMRNTTSVYLASASFLQIAFIIATSIRRVPELIYGEAGQIRTKFYYVSALYLSIYIGTMLLRTVYCLVMLISLERMMAILFPMRRARSRLVKSPVLCIVSLILVSLSFHSFTVFELYITETKTDRGDIVYGIKKTGYDHMVIKNFSIASKVLFVYLPLIGIFVFNVVLCVALKRLSLTRKALQEGNEDKRREAKERQTTVAILVSTCIFFVLALPMTTNSIVGNLLPGYGPFSPLRYTYMFVQETGGLLNILSYILDCVTYVVMSSKYRMTLMSKFSPNRFRDGLKTQSSQFSGITSTSTQHSRF